MWSRQDDRGWVAWGGSHGLLWLSSGDLRLEKGREAGLYGLEYMDSHSLSASTSSILAVASFSHDMNKNKQIAKPEKPIINHDSTCSITSGSEVCRVFNPIGTVRLFEKGNH